MEAGCYEVSHGDTLRISAPAEVRKPVTYLRGNGVPLEKLAGHFHGTYGSAVATVWEAYKCGLRAFDSSVAGLGGCPFAPGARGNVASEDLVYMFERPGIHTGPDLSKLLSIPNSSRGGAALLMKRKQKAGHKPFKSTRSLSWKVIQETEGLQLFRSGVNLKINLNRPKNGNALTVARVQDLTAVVTNAGKHGSGPGDSSSNAQFNRLTNFFEASDQSPKVTIACLNGPAFGGGVGLASACDLRYAVKGASVTLSEVKLGLCAATISRYVIREWGVAFAREAMLSARSAAAEELIARGLVVAIADSVEALDWPLDGALIGFKVASPGASRMALFDGMMRPDGEGSYGVKEFQAKRPVDWDAYTLRQVERAKL
ncbi:ClpP/crotonase-like domain-containing protein [Aspergillus falconensis]